MDLLRFLEDQISNYVRNQGCGGSVPVVHGKSDIQTKPVELVASSKIILGILKARQMTNAN